MIVKMIQYFRKRMEAQIKKIQETLNTPIFAHRVKEENREGKRPEKIVKDTMAENLPRWEVEQSP